MKHTYFHQIKNGYDAGTKLSIRNIFKGSILAAGLLTMIFFYGCDPTQMKKEELGSIPSADAISITVSPGKDKFRYVVTATSPVSSIAKWDYGNGSTGTDKDTAYYPVAGTYIITLTLYTKGGSVSKTEQITTTETDWSYFNRPDIIALSGGTASPTGKTWVLDSLSYGHIGVGPAGSNGLDWWGAPALGKQGVEMYDDNLNFTLTGFACTYTNHGKSYVKTFQASNPNYSNQVTKDGDIIVDFTPAPGLWSLQDRGSDKYLIMTSSKPIFPCFDVGATNGSYKILALETNRLELVATGGDGNAWHYQLIPEGYVKPTIKLDLTVTGGPNDFSAQLVNIQVPSGMSITKVVWSFGDGTANDTETDYTKVITHKYLRKNSYLLTATLTTSAGNLVKTQTINVNQNDPSYVPYLLNDMVMYQDFGETSLVPMGFDNSDGSGSITKVANPDASLYPDRSADVGKYTKVNAQYANAFLLLPTGYRFNLTLQTTFKLLVYGQAGDDVLLKLENTDKGGNAWMTGTNDVKYKIKKSNTWEVATYDFKGIGSNGAGDIVATDITTDPRFNDGYYNVIRIMYRPGDNSGTFTFYLDDL
ncbi:MAG TPA: hypothetical protein VIH57_05630, partial [Bacteroidales bacterium]